MTIENTLLEKTSAEAIEAFERKLGYRLPEDYVDFLLTYNGGFVNPSHFDIYNGREQSSTGFLYGLTENKQYKHLGLNYNMVMTMGSDVPEDVLPISHDPGGSNICMSLAEADYGQIYFADDEVPNEDEKGNVTRDNMQLIARSFTEFLSKLTDRKV